MKRPTKPARDARFDAVRSLPMEVFDDKFGRRGWMPGEWEALSFWQKLRFKLSTTWDPRRAPRRDG